MTGKQSARREFKADWTGPWFNRVKRKAGFSSRLIVDLRTFAPSQQRRIRDVWCVVRAARINAVSSTC